MRSTKHGSSHSVSHHHPMAHLTILPRDKYPSSGWKGLFNSCSCFCNFYLFLCLGIFLLLGVNTIKRKSHWLALLISVVYIGLALLLDSIIST